MANKPKITIGFVDYWKPFDQFMIDWLSKRFDVSLLNGTDIDHKTQYLFFCDETFGTVNQQPQCNRDNIVRIFYTGENRRPENYAADFAISFDHFDTKNHYRLPLYVIDHWVMVNKLGMPTWMEMEERRLDHHYKGVLATQRDFCCFISGNGVSQKRNDWFHKLNAYKKVDSYGPLFNNVGYILPRGPEAAKNKFQILPKYKFNLCFENSSYPGYCTEKLFHALYMDTIPIYWGSPTAEMDFNPESFITWHEKMDDEKMFSFICALDNEDILYHTMYQKPFITNYGRYFDENRFLDWFQHNVYKG